jgi:hypothetical protein
MSAFTIARQALEASYAYFSRTQQDDCSTTLENKKEGPVARRAPRTIRGSKGSKTEQTPSKSLTSTKPKKALDGWMPERKNQQPLLNITESNLFTSGFSTRRF